MRKLFGRAIAVGLFVGCFIAVFCSQEVGAAIGDWSSHHKFIVYPSKAIKCINEANFSVKIDNKCTALKSGNYARIKRLSLFNLLAGFTRTQCEQRSIILVDGNLQERRTSSVRFTMVNIVVNNFVSWGFSSVFDANKCFRTSNVFNSFDIDSIDKYISPQLPSLGISGSFDEFATIDRRLVHLTKLPGEDHGLINGCASGNEREERKGTCEDGQTLSPFGNAYLYFASVVVFIGGLSASCRATWRLFQDCPTVVFIGWITLAAVCVFGGFIFIRFATAT